MMPDDKETIMDQEGTSALLSGTVPVQEGSLLKASVQPMDAHNTSEQRKPTPEEVIPGSIRFRAEYKRKFSFLEMYRSFVCVPSAIMCMVGNNKSKLVDPDLVRRIQLAVTEVNGCAACSYEHAKRALRQGMSGAEISSFLSGADGFIKPEEAKAIVFAQHFADSRGFPKEYAYEAIVREYGEKKARIMLAAAQVMIAGNMYGIPYSAFQSRLKGKPFKDSSLFFELGMLIGGVLCLPVAILHAVLRGSFDLENERLDRSTTDQRTTGNIEQ
ncbi:MAG TPA: carboxymuconolactone decarboxylase family protein [Flavobacteriales bacterium]|nr:carboxymuconolactone decarboxylase family protein [Flavobacteriales bacterium]HRA18687.1 carboxymuconolactone decarboxylase family protein [Flavobacteriales bacterium]